MDYKVKPVKGGGYYGNNIHIFRTTHRTKLIRYTKYIECNSFRTLFKGKNNKIKVRQNDGTQNKSSKRNIQ